MNTMNIEEWIRSRVGYAASYLDDLEVIPADALRRLLKTHALVPREATHKMLLAGNAVLPSAINSDGIFEAMIKASEVGE